MQHAEDVLRPPGLQVDPEIGNFFSFMSRFAPSSPEERYETPVDVQRSQRRSAARTSFAFELVYDRTLTRACPANDSEPTEEESKLMCPDIKAYAAGIRHLVGLCDRMYRSSIAECAGLPAEGRFAARSAFFELACACYRPEVSEPLVSIGTDASGALIDIDFNVSFQTFTDAVCGMTVPEDAYGSAGDIVKLERECLHHLRQAAMYTEDLVKRMRDMNFVGRVDCHVVGPFESYDEILSKIDRCIHSNQLHCNFNHDLDQRKLSLDNAHATFDLLQSRVSEHLARRRADNHAHLQHMGDDVFARMAQHLDTKSAVALMGTCAEYGGKAALKARMPHMHVRFIVGSFPHHRATSRDREALAQNQLRPVVRDFVLTRQTVRLYVDFVRPTLRTAPLKKKERTDGRSNINHDFSDDEYEDPPESLSLRGPRMSNTHDLATAWGRRLSEGERRVRKRWLDAEGPEERLDRFVHNKRIPYGNYFTTPLKITPCLVYADSKEPVPCSRFKGGLDLSNQLLCDGGHFTQSTKWLTGDQMPASAKFHIPHLSSDHGGRLFCLRLTGTALLVKSGNPFTQVVYTQPFEVVSKLDVIKKASKRRTAEQISEDAAKRAKSKSAKKQPAARPP